MCDDTVFYATLSRDHLYSALRAAYVRCPAWVVLACERAEYGSMLTS